jgi:hypothetical protein
MKSSHQPKVLRAYLCTADEAEDTEIVFAATNGAARFPYARRLDWDFRDVKVRRAPEYDAYAPGPVPVSVMLDHGWRFECFECYRMLSLDMDFVENMSSDDLKHWARSNAPHVAALEEFDAANPEPAGAPDSCTPQERWAAENKQREWRARRERLSIKIIPPALSRKALRINDAAAECFCDAHCEQKAHTRRALLAYAHDQAVEEAQRRWPGCLAYASNGPPYTSPQVSITVPGCRHPVLWRPGMDSVHTALEDADAWQSFTATLKDETDGKAKNQAAA